MKRFFYRMPQNLIGSFTGKNLFYHLAAIGLTYIIVVSDFDWFYYMHSRDVSLSPLLFPAVVVGGILPIITPFILLALGKFYRNIKLMSVGYTLGQAGFLGWLISSGYKALTGRVHPEFLTGQVLTDISKQFQFGILRGGVFWGWPSSHTTVAFSIAFALIALYPKNKWVKILSILYAFYIGLGISVSVHWFSEFVAGALIGIAIGTVVGKSFKNREGSAA